MRGFSGPMLSATGAIGLVTLVLGYYRFRARRQAGSVKREPERRSLSRTSNHPSTSTSTAGPSGVSALGSARAPPERASPAQTGEQAAYDAAAGRLLNGVEAVSVSVWGTLLERQEGGEAAAVAGAREALSALSRRAEVYCLAQVCDDVEEAVARAALEHGGVVGRGEGQVPPHRLLFCETGAGKASLVRQLEPGLHIDADQETVRALQRFVPRLVCVDPAGMGAPSPANVVYRSSLRSAMGL